MDKEIFGLPAGDAATWALALIGIATLFAAIGAWRSSSKLLWVEQRRDEQAQQISAWAEPDVGRNLGHGYFFASVKAIVNNPTNLPVYGVQISWERSISSSLTQGSDSRWEKFKTDVRDLVAPNDTAEFSIDNNFYEEIHGEAGSANSMASESVTLENAQAVANKVRIGVSFTDALGKKWVRLSNGKLQKVK